LKNIRNNTKKLKTTEKKTISNATNKKRGGFNSLESAPKERSNIKGGSRTQRKTLGGLKPLGRKPLATQQRQGVGRFTKSGTKGEE